MSQKLPTVAIVGQTNVGKSSLFNRIYGSQEAVVAREAGTTRDNVIRRITLSLEGRRMNDGERKKHRPQSALAVSSDVLRIEHLSSPHFSDTRPDSTRTKRSAPAVDGVGDTKSDRHEDNRSKSSASDDADITQSFWLVDTAGLKTAEDEFEASIQDQITEATEAADVIIVMVDGTQYPSDRDRTIAKKALRSKKPVLLVINKTDLKSALPSDEFRRLGISTIIRTSAEHAVGINQLTDAILAALPPASSIPLSAREASLRIALIGRPNVGKSYLFNTLAGKQQAIVANVAGTTRDVNRIGVTYKGREIEILDTAGIRRSGKQEVGIEKFSVLRTLQAIEESDVCFLIMDVNEHSTQLDQKLAGIIKEAGKGLVIVISKWDSIAEKDPKLADQLGNQIAFDFAFVPWAPLLFTSSVTGHNVTRIFELATQIDTRRHQEIKTRQLNDILQHCVSRHPPAGLKNTFPKLRYMVQTDTAPPWFVIFGSNLKLLHWSYKRYLERQMREAYDFTGTPINFSFRQEKDK